MQKPNYLPAISDASHCSTFAFTGEHIDYVASMGGKCRDCADENGICPGTGLPCAGKRLAIQYVLDAIEYGVKHGFVANPNT